MIKEIKETRIVTEPKDFVVERKLICDHCNQLILQGFYFHVTTGHHDWGNDSIDSIEGFDVHEECIQNFFKEKVECDDMTASYTGYIDVEKQRNNNN